MEGTRMGAALCWTRGSRESSPAAFGELQTTETALPCLHGEPTYCQNRPKSSSNGNTLAFLELSVCMFWGESFNFMIMFHFFSTQINLHNSTFHGLLEIPLRCLRINLLTERQCHRWKLMLLPPA